MSPSPIIKGFDVIKGDASGLCACLKGLAINALAFERVKKAFHGCIVVTMRRATHADDHAFLSQERLIVFTVIGTPTISVME